MSDSGCQREDRKCSLWYCRFCRAIWNFVTPCQETMKDQQPSHSDCHQASSDRAFLLPEWGIQTVLSLSLTCTRHYADPGCNQALPFRSFKSALQFSTCFNSTDLVTLVRRSMACFVYLYRTQILAKTQVTQATFCLPDLRVRLLPLWYAWISPGPYCLTRTFAPSDR